MKKILIALVIIIVAFAVLFISIFDSSSINYSLSQNPGSPLNSPENPEIYYVLPYMGRVLPDSPFWRLKALRDRIWLGVTTSHLRKAELALLFADKRLVMSEELFKRGEPDIAMSTFTKGEKYLVIVVNEENIARKSGVDTSAFLGKMATAALKHREIAEDLIQLAPENARPLIVKTEMYAIDTYVAARNALNSKGLPVPKDPFDGE